MFLGRLPLSVRDLLLLGYLSLACQAADIKGRVLAENGSPASQTKVVALTLGGKSIGTASADYEGRFEFAGLAVGVYRIRFVPSSYRLLGVTAEHVSVPRFADLTVHLPSREGDPQGPASLHRLSGEVTDQNRPVASAEVCVFGEAESILASQGKRRYAYCAVTDQDGWYQHLLPKGRYSIMVRVEDQVRLYTEEFIVPWGQDQVKSLHLTRK